jgi:hypothetical protein
MSAARAWAKFVKLPPMGKELRMMSRIGRWIPAAVLMALIFTASAIPGSEIPGFGFWDFIFKKGGHMIGYALLAASYSLALNAGEKEGCSRLVFAACLATVYSVTDEWHQGFTPGRTPSAWDVFIDAAGAVIGILLWRRFRTGFERSRRAED